MKLYLIRCDTSYDAYEAAIIAAPNEETARLMHPHNGKSILSEENQPRHILDTWTNNPDEVVVIYLGIADESIPQGIIYAAYISG